MNQRTNINRIYVLATLAVVNFILFSVYTQKDLYTNGSPNDTINLDDFFEKDLDVIVNKEEKPLIPHPVVERMESLPDQNSTLSSTMNDQNTTTFKHYDGVVIVTKVIGQIDTQKLKRHLCMLSHAYNDRMNYDIVVFTTLPWDKKNVRVLQDIVAPAKLTVALESAPLEEQLVAMPEEERDFLRTRCGLKLPNETLSYNNWCTEPGYNGGYISLGYSWQAEFRAYHIWTHEALKDYKYMMWLDSDALVSKVWDKDPMKPMVEDNLIILYSSFNYGRLRNTMVKDKMFKHYNRSICHISQCHERGGLCPEFCEDNPSMRFLVKQIGGYHHITNLDVYRKPIHQKFLKDFVGIHRFSREMDDQIAVTLPALMEQSIRNDGKVGVANEQSRYDLHLMIAHHGNYDDAHRGKNAPRNPSVLFNKFAESDPTLRDRCQW